MRGNILLIEDNAQNRYLIKFLLENEGFSVTCASDGRTGIELARKIQPRLILLDIQLPEMDGYAVARELRKDSSLSSIPIVAVTSYAMVGDREKILSAGCNGYMEKPIDPDTFVGDIERFIASQ